jgi:sugar phosphate isomerase/epimerase
MHVSFITDEYSQDIGAALQFASENGIPRVELRSLWGKNCLALSSDECRALQELLTVHSAVKISGLDTFIFKGSWADPGILANGLSMAERACELAQLLGARFIRIFAFWKDAAPSLGHVATQIGHIGRMAQQCGLKILVENGTFSSVGTGGLLKALLTQVGQCNVQALWDAGNVINGGWNESIEEGARQLGPLIGHVHVKAPYRNSVGRICYGKLLGGLINWPGHISLLDELQFNGDLSIETHWRIGRELDGRTVLDYPEGEAFSKGGAEATRLMVAELGQVLHGMQPWRAPN